MVGGNVRQIECDFSVSHKHCGISQLSSLDGIVIAAVVVTEQEVLPCKGPMASSARPAAQSSTSQCRSTSVVREGARQTLD
jgi:hypothetical protein